MKPATNTTSAAKILGMGLCFTTLLTMTLCLHFFAKIEAKTNPNTTFDNPAQNSIQFDIAPPSTDENQNIATNLNHPANTLQPPHKKQMMPPQSSAANEIIIEPQSAEAPTQITQNKTTHNAPNLQTNQKAAPSQQLPATTPPDNVLLAHAEKNANIIPKAAPTTNTPPNTTSNHVTDHIKKIAHKAPKKKPARKHWLLQFGAFHHQPYATALQKKLGQLQIDAEIAQDQKPKGTLYRVLWPEIFNNQARALKFKQQLKSLVQIPVTLIVQSI